MNDNLTAEIPTATISVKIPPFWSDDLELWFLQVEAQFRVRGIKAETTKYDHVLQALPPDTVSRLRTFLLDPPKENPYSAMKRELLRQTALSAKQKYDRLISDEVLGDRTPSQLLQRMQALVGEQQAETPFFREMFVSKLPPTVQTVIAALDGSPVIQIAAVADKMMEYQTPSPQVTHISRSTARSPTARFQEQLDSLSHELRELRMEVRTRSRSRSCRRDGAANVHRRSPVPQHNSSDDDLCWYHTNFGERARRCRSPCSFSKNVRGSE